LSSLLYTDGEYNIYLTRLRNGEKEDLYDKMNLENRASYINTL